MQTRTAVCPSPRRADDIITEHISYLYLLSDVLSMCWLMLKKIKGITVFRQKGKIETWLLCKEIIRLFEDELPYMSDPNTFRGTAELFPGTWLKRWDKIGFCWCCCWENYALKFLRSSMTSVLCALCFSHRHVSFSHRWVGRECHGWIRSRQ